MVVCGFEVCVPVPSPYVRIELTMSIVSIQPTDASVPEYLEDHDRDGGSRVPGTGVFTFARMAGSSIAGRDAAFWVTDFLNAAYYRRAAEERDVDDLRLMICGLRSAC